MGSSQPRDGTQVSCIAGGSLPSEPPGKPPVYRGYMGQNILKDTKKHNLPDQTVKQMRIRGNCQQIRGVNKMEYTTLFGV